MSDLSRRWILKGALFVAAAPVIVRASDLTEVERAALATRIAIVPR